MRVVVDASVAVKWLLPDPAKEPGLDRALSLLREIRRGAVEVLQPAHWLAEVTAVLVRAAPGKAPEALELLWLLELPIADDLAVYRRAALLARQLDHHLFDTLYHAVALEHDAVLVSADDSYFRKAARFGRVVPLSTWEPSGA